MKMIFVFVILLMGVAQGARSEQGKDNSTVSGAGRVRVSVLGLRNREGDIQLALFNGRQGFPGKDRYAFMRGVVPASGEPLVFMFDNVPFGSYAVSVRHDENRNGKLDTNLIGMPKEGVGSSNNHRSKFGPPSFEDSRFELDRDIVDLIIHMRYL